SGEEEAAAASASKVEQIEEQLQEVEEEEEPILLQEAAEEEELTVEQQQHHHQQQLDETEEAPHRKRFRRLNDYEQERLLIEREKLVTLREIQRGIECKNDILRGILHVLQSRLVPRHRKRWQSRQVATVRYGHERYRVGQRVRPQLTAVLLELLHIDAQIREHEGEIVQIGGGTIVQLGRAHAKLADFAQIALDQGGQIGEGGWLCLGPADCEAHLGDGHFQHVRRM
uniref:Uncharacterized protein n=1 Tax=Anopheles melas TaxID=34690 RepID=A0A182UC80_9DIPT